MENTVTVYQPSVIHLEVRRTKARVQLGKSADVGLLIQFTEPTTGKNPLLYNLTNTRCAVITVFGVLNLSQHISCNNTQPFQERDTSVQKHKTKLNSAFTGMFAPHPLIISVFGR